MASQLQEVKMPTELDSIWLFECHCSSIRLNVFEYVCLCVHNLLFSFWIVPVGHGSILGVVQKFMSRVLSLGLCKVICLSAYEMIYTNCNKSKHTTHIPFSIWSVGSCLYRSFHFTCNQEQLSQSNMKCWYEPSVREHLVCELY